MAFYIFRQNTITKPPPMIVDHVPNGIESLDWLSGNSLTTSALNDKPIQLEIAITGRLKSGIVDGLLTLYHYRLCDALTEFGVTNIQAFPVVLHDKESGEISENYRVVNIVGLLDCIDKEKSKVKPWPSGRGFDFLSMAIDQQKVQGLAIFRLKDDPTKVVINEDLKQYLQTIKMTAGIKFIKTEDYSDW